MQRINFFFHPLPVLAVLLLAVNDHYLKYEFGNSVTGKLSDFAGMFFFPIFLAALVVLSTRTPLNKRIVIGSILASDLLLLSIKLSPQVSDAVTIFFERYLFEIQIINDPTDLWALAMNIPTYLFLSRYFETTRK